MIWREGGKLLENFDRVESLITRRKKFSFTESLIMKEEKIIENWRGEEEREKIG
jgi:hypothetical protein